MKIFKSCVAMLALALAATSCTDDVLMEQEQVATENFSIKVEMGRDSRSMFPNENATKQVWSKGDKILVYGENSSGILTLEGDGGDQTGVFSGSVYGSLKRLKYVVYPADHATLKDGKVTFNYDADANSIKYPNTNMPMWGEYNKTKVQLNNLAGAVRVYINNIPDNSTLRLIARGLAGEAEFLPEEGKIYPKAYDSYVSSMAQVPNMDIAVKEIPAGTEYVDVPVYIGKPDGTGIEARPLGIYLNGVKLAGSVPTVPTKIGSVSYKKVPKLVWNESAPVNSKLTRESAMDENTEPAEKVEENTDPKKGCDYLIDSAEKLLWFADQVNTKGNDFAGKIVKLGTSIDLNNQKWTPIDGGAKPFQGEFDGDNFMISNLKVETEGKASAGLFAQSLGVIKNLYLQNVDIKGHYKAGAVVGDGICAKIDNCHVDGGTILSTPYNNDDANHVGGIVGYLSAESAAYVKNCSVNDLKITAYRDVAGIAGSACRKELDVTGCTVSNTTITADMTAEYKEEKDANAGAIVGRLLKKEVEITGNTVGEGVEVIVKVKNTDQLVGALKNGVSNIYLVEGNYELAHPTITADNVSIIGTDKDKCVLKITKQIRAKDGVTSLTLKNLTTDVPTGLTYNEFNFAFIHYLKNFSMIDCNSNGRIRLNVHNATISNCVFNVTTKSGFDGYAIFQYGANNSNVKVEYSEFNTVGKAIVLYNEGTPILNLDVNECTFTSSDNTTDKAAIQMHTELGISGTVEITKSTATGFADINDGLWNEINNNNGTPTTKFDITVDGKLVHSAK